MYINKDIWAPVVNYFPSKQFTESKKKKGKIFNFSEIRIDRKANQLKVMSGTL